MTLIGGVELVCPGCHGDLGDETEQLRCAACAAVYPVVAGVPDLRVAPDPWIGLAEDRAKALRVLEESDGLDFEATVRVYWRLTPGTPGAQAERFVAHVLRARERSGEWLAADTRWSSDDGVWLDEGCGTADVAAAAPARARVVSLDVAMRWLVIARKRLEEAGRPTYLVCANAEALPFLDGTFTRVSSLGLLEHCADPVPVLREAGRVLRAGGVLRGRTVNRFSILPEPHVGLWGVGFLPRGWARRYVSWRTGLGYDHHRPCSVSELKRALRDAGLAERRVVAAPALDTELRGAGPRLRGLTPLYERGRMIPGVGGLVSRVAPLLEISGVAPGRAGSRFP